MIMTGEDKRKTTAETLLGDNLPIKCSAYNTATGWTCPNRRYCLRFYVHVADYRTKQHTTDSEPYAEYQTNHCSFRHLPPMGYSEFIRKLNKITHR